MVLNSNAEPKKVLCLMSRALEKVLKIVPKSRAIKGFSEGLEPFMIHYDIIFLDSNDTTEIQRH